MSCVVVSDKGAASGWTVLVLVLVAPQFINLTPCDGYAQ